MLIKIEKIKIIKLRIEPLRKSLIPVFEIPTLYLELKKIEQTNPFGFPWGCCHFSCRLSHCSSSLDAVFSWEQKLK